MLSVQTKRFGPGRKTFVGYLTSLSPGADGEIVLRGTTNPGRLEPSKGSALPWRPWAFCGNADPDLTQSGILSNGITDGLRESAEFPRILHARMSQSVRTKTESVIYCLHKNVVLKLRIRGCRKSWSHSFLWEEEIMATRPPLPPFTHENTKQKVRLAEDGWNSRDLVKSGARLRAGFPLEKPLGVCQWQTRDLAFLTRKWNKELDYRLIKEL